MWGLGLLEEQPGQEIEEGGGLACLLVAFLQPFVEALRDDYAPFLVLHGCPHAFVFEERVVATVDGLGERAVIGASFRPRRYES